MRLVKALLLLAIVLWALLTGYVIMSLRERFGRGGPFPASRAAILHHPLRRRFDPPERTLELFGLKPGDVVLELGPGSGYFTAKAAEMVGPEGRILCVDVQPEMIALLRDRLDGTDTANAHGIAGDATKLPLADRSVDAAYLVTVFGEIPDRVAALHELRRVLKPGGTVSFSEMLLDPDYVLQGTLVDLCRATGFTEMERVPGLVGYAMTFAAPAGPIA